MNIILEVDLISGTVSGDLDGYKIPLALSNLPLESLRFDSDDIIDASAIVDWLIDGHGQKRLPSMHASSGFQVLQCAIDDKLIFENDVWRVETQADIDAETVAARLIATKAECRRRIYEVASTETQMNMGGVAAYISSKTAGSRTSAEVDHLNDYKASLDWVASMRGNILVLMADDQLDMQDDANWTAIPANVQALSDQF